MNKHNFFVTFLKTINLSINNLLKKYLNKLKFNNLLNNSYSNKVLLTFTILFILFISYLSIPHIYSKVEIRKELENQFFNKFGLNLVVSKNFKYKFFPRPHFIVKDSFILENELKISDIKELQIFVSLNNLFSSKNVIINEVNLVNANFNINQQNYNFFLKLLQTNFSESTFKIKNSNVFYKNEDKEVVFINKIINMHYYYDPKELKNIINSKNEIFNIPYSFIIHQDEEKKIFSKINLDFMNLRIENKLNYNDDIKKGLTNFIYNKNKSFATYEFNKNYFNFDFYKSLTNSNFFYKGKINLNPFYSNLMGNDDEINLSMLFSSNGMLAQLLKTEILNQQNLNLDLSIRANKIQNYKNFTNIFLNSKIQEGLVDIDNTQFSWKKYANFKLSNSLIYVSENELIFDGKLAIDIIEPKEIYKFLLTPRNYRAEIKHIELTFNYNFDQKIINLNEIKINNQANQNVKNAIKNIIFKNSILQNKIYIKNTLNKAIKSYSG